MRICMICEGNITVWALWKIATIPTNPSSPKSSSVIEEEDLFIFSESSYEFGYFMRNEGTMKSRCSKRNYAERG
jgi:hypothetical protein